VQVGSHTCIIPGFSYVSTLSSNGACARSAEITSTGNGAPPRVVTHSSGNCGPEPNTGTNTGWSSPGIVRVPVMPPPRNRPDALWTKNETTQPYAGIIQQAKVQH